MTSLSISWGRLPDVTPFRRVELAVRVAGSSFLDQGLVHGSFHASGIMAPRPSSSFFALDELTMSNMAMSLWLGPGKERIGYSASLLASTEDHRPRSSWPSLHAPPQPSQSCAF